MRAAGPRRRPNALRSLAILLQPACGHRASRRGLALTERAVETHENWLEQHRYLNMDDLREHKKEGLRSSCTCPDHAETGQKCKHIYAVEHMLRDTTLIPALREPPNQDVGLAGHLGLADDPSCRVDNAQARAFQ
jgi:hypothetical protein